MVPTITYVAIRMNSPFTWGIELKEELYGGDKKILILVSLYLTITVIDVITWIIVLIYVIKYKECGCNK